MYFHKDFECMPKTDLKKLQSEKLVKQVKYVYDNVECYRKRMDEAGIKPEDIKGIEDLKKLPFSYKSDLRDYYPYGLFAKPLSEIVELHASSGTTGKRIVVGYTKNDLEMWADCTARMLTSIGATKDDIVQVAYGYGLFTGGFGLHYGAEKLGLTVIPISAGNTERQIEAMIDFKATILACTPSYALYLAETAEKMGVVDQLSLKAGIFGAEPWTEEMRKQIEEKLHIKAYDIYGLTEIVGPGVAYECNEQKGMHVNEDHFIVEVIDPNTLEPIEEEGKLGELVFSTIDREGAPLLRYRTRDLGVVQKSTCKCGRTFVRLSKPQGRSDDMLIIRGVNVFPSQIEGVLLQYCDKGITANYQIVVDRLNNNDTLDIFVEMAPDLFADDMASIERLQKQLVDKLRSVLGIGAKVTLVNPNSIARSEGKAKRVIDKRKLI
ncbi:MAG: phenylacetate--CoA ligase [Acholeplasmatales bacterium]|nr:phenylacetate--CoA ligase [Acholeplasmatales bacterium]